MQVAEEKAIELAEGVDYNNWTAEEIFLFQISQEKLSMDFEVFHKATEKVLDRPVFTHEFADTERLFDEYIKKKSGG